MPSVLLKYDVKLIAGLAALALIVCVQAISACSARQTPATVPVEPVQIQSEPPAVAIHAPDPAAEAKPPAAADPDDCSIIPASGDAIATVGVSDPIDPRHAPRPTNDGERLLFRQLYETLVNVDCAGRVRPALAGSWHLDANERTWIVTLRDDSRFADGSPLTADDVRASLSGDGNRNQLHPVEAIVTIDDRTLAIALTPGRSDVRVLAHPDLAISKPVADSAWPLGTRASRIAPTGDEKLRRPTVLTITRDALPSLRFIVSPGDPRDLLDGGADLMLTRDAAALDYARTLPHFQTIALAWQRTHVLLTPDRALAPATLTAEARQTLANDAVRGEARGAREPFWWHTIGGCDVLPPPPRGRTSPAPRIVYGAGDQASRDLSERLVALARAQDSAAATALGALVPDRTRTHERAVGMTGTALAQALRLGADAGYVMSIDSRPVDPCRDLRWLLGVAPWLDPDSIVPLIETRLQAVVRRGRSGISVEWDGGLVIAGASASRPQ